jgi:hypothetical protein
VETVFLVVLGYEEKCHLRFSTTTTTNVILTVCSVQFEPYSLFSIICSTLLSSISQRHQIEMSKAPSIHFASAKKQQGVRDPCWLHGDRPQNLPTSFKAQRCRFAKARIDLRQLKIGSSLRLQRYLTYRLYLLVQYAT